MNQSVQDPLIGTLFDQRYLINYLVARGGMGNIYQAHDTKRGHIVAVKLLRSEYVNDGVVVQRFLREAHAVRILKHPNICQLFDLNLSSKGDYYFTMEFLEGHALDSILEKQHVLKPTTAIEYIIQVASGLSEAHAHGIVHRDMKPANIFIVQTPGAPEFVKIIDFGVAKTPTGNNSSKWDPKLTNAGSTVGTPFYMSPEQVRGLDCVDGRTDVYALGIILWECIFGAPPFTGKGLLEVFEQTLNAKLPKLPPQYRGHAIYEKTYKVLTKALEKDMNRRIKSMQELIRELEKCLSSTKNKNQVTISSSFNNSIKNTPVNLKAYSGPFGRCVTALAKLGPVKIVAISIGIAFVICLGILAGVMLAPSQVAIAQTNYTTYKFFSDIPSEIRVSQKTIGTTPSSVDLKETPPFDVEFAATSGEQFNFHVEGINSDVQGFAVNLDPKRSDTPTLYVESTPSGAKVYIDGQPTGERTPCEIPIESLANVKVTIDLDGYIPERIQTAHRGADFHIKTNLLPK